MISPIGNRKNVCISNKASRKQAPNLAGTWDKIPMAMLQLPDHTSARFRFVEYYSPSNIQTDFINLEVINNSGKVTSLNHDKKYQSDITVLPICPHDSTQLCTEN